MGTCALSLHKIRPIRVLQDDEASVVLSLLRRRTPSNPHEQLWGMGVPSLSHLAVSSFMASLRESQLMRNHSLWILFCLGLTLLWTILLAKSSPSEAHDYPLSRKSSQSSTPMYTEPPSRRSTIPSSSRSWPRRLHYELFHSRGWLRYWFQMSLIRSRSLIVYNYITAFGLWLLFIIGKFL
jgi:hypothetical protein